ncbi:fba [Wigglesworthia glossinidia endosymbiont of Glossina brevipalpis]|uniref:Fructose-bisphosphate aldolase n=1 Tax=Wigglesworthia glossinidia brevipalpis TaxID=36870 RepID=Q8D2P8_WIGBR|nr:fba [Wigglesworthia glossinidia endosymbiont of Glossina brevipalpis]
MSNILDSINTGVIYGKDIEKLFSFAKEKKFAIPAINCIGTDSINAALEAASIYRSPIIIQFSHGGSSFIAGKKMNCNKGAILGAISGALHVHNISKEYKIPVILHTDHCSKNILPWIDELLKESEKRFFNFGKPLFSSHMIDLSSEPLEENIKISKKYLEKMKRLNIILEIELGCTGGEEDGIIGEKANDNKLYTNPKDVCYAYENLTKVGSNFIVAASFGNCHGVYNPGNVKLKPCILQLSQEYVSKKFRLNKNPLNLVFHGGSGSSYEDIKKSIEYGVIKMNIDTDTQWATWNGVLNFYKKNKNYLKSQLGNPEGKNKPNKKFYDPRNWISHAKNSMIIKLKSIFKLLNSINVL